MALVARPAFAKSPWSLIDDQPSHRDDVDPGAPTVVNRSIAPCRGLPATTMIAYEANACWAGVGRVAVGRCRGDSRCGCRPSPSRAGAAVVAGLSPRPPGGPLSLVPRRSPGAD